MPTIRDPQDGVDSRHCVLYVPWVVHAGSVADSWDDDRERLSYSMTCNPECLHAFQFDAVVEQRSDLGPLNVKLPLGELYSFSRIRFRSWSASKLVIKSDRHDVRRSAVRLAAQPGGFYL